MAVTCTACETGWQGSTCSECTIDSVCGTSNYCTTAGACAVCTSIGEHW